MRRPERPEPLGCPLRLQTMFNLLQDQKWSSKLFGSEIKHLALLITIVFKRYASSRKPHFRRLC